MPILLAAALLAQTPVDAAAPAALADPADVFVVVVLDDSGSMERRLPGAGRAKMDAAKDALLAVYDTLPDNTAVGLLTLNTTWQTEEGTDPPGGTHEALPVAPADPGVVRGTVTQIRAAGGTPLGERLADATRVLEQVRAARKYGRYRLLVVTDGEATDAAELEAAVPRALAAGFTLDVIGVAMAADHTLADRADSYRRADDPGSLSAAIAAVLAEAGGGAGASEDYDELAPLPDDAAPVLLAALAAPPALDDDPRPAGPAPVPQAPTPPAAPRVAVEAPGVGAGGLVCCLAVPVGAGLLVLFVVAKIIAAGQRRR